jgi:predicted nucleotidyltransferase
MTNTLARSLEITHDRVDPLVLEVIRKVDAIAHKHNTSYFLAGATAREIILRHVFGLRPGRRTLDVDFAIAVRDWQHFQDMKTALIEEAGFIAVASVVQRVKYPGPPPMIIDLIPFGGVENADETIAWPPDGDIVMHVAGFGDALVSAVQVRLDDSLTIPVVSIPVLIVLKLFAWMDRRQENNKDADDMFTILRQYADAGNEDRLFGERLVILEEEEFDFEMAGARLAGIDAAGLISDQTRTRASGILRSDENMDHLTRQIIATAGGLEGERAGRCEQIVTKFRNEFLGFEERRQSD